MPVDPDQLLRQRLRHAVPPVIGGGIAWALYPRDRRTSLNLVLDIAADLLGADPRLVRVDGGSAEVLAVGGLPQPVVLWSRRHLEANALLRALLLTDGVSARVRRGLCRRLCLAMLAEMALRLGEPDLAARCAVGAFADGEPLGSEVAPSWLDASPLSEAQVALWFYAIGHELGHFRDPRVFARGPLSESTVRAMLHEAGRRPVDDVQALLDAGPASGAGRRSRRRPLRTDDVRAEAVADLFAAELLLAAAKRLLPDGGHPVPLIGEILLAGAVLATIERCRAFCALLGRHAGPDDHSTYPAAAHVRGGLLRAYLATAMADRYAHGDPPDADDLHRWDRIVTGVATPLEPSLAALDAGVADAMRFALDDSVPMDRMLDRLRVRADPRLRAEARPFVTLAKTGGRHGEWLDQLIFVLD